MIALMSALTVVGNFADHILSLGIFQSGTAIVIIAGISLGPEAGFLAGLIFSKMDNKELKSASFRAIITPIIFIIASLILGYVIFLFTAKEEDQK